ncbi:MAG: CARDB domain-containing protein [Candidatus Methanofastidiosia archaeon]
MKLTRAGICCILLTCLLPFVSASTYTLEMSVDRGHANVYLGQVVEFNMTVRNAVGDGYNTSPPTSPPTTSPPTTTLQPPPPPSGEPMGAASFYKPSSQIYGSFLAVNHVYFGSEAPDGLDVSFYPDHLSLTDNELGNTTIRVHVSEEMPPGEYSVLVTAKSNFGSQNSIELTLTVLQFIDLVIEDATTEPDNPKEGENIKFNVFITNHGEASSGEIACVLYNKDSNETLDSKQLTIGAGATEVAELVWDAIEGEHHFKVYVSSPENEKVVTNNIFFIDLSVDKADTNKNLAEQYFLEGVNFYSSEEWEDAINAFLLAERDYEAREDASNVALCQNYISTAQKYEEAQIFFDEGIKAKNEKRFDTALEKLRGAENIYTSLEDLSKLNLCFNEILSVQREMKTNKTGARYPWHFLILPLIAAAIYVGYANKEKLLPVPKRKKSEKIEYIESIIEDLDKRFIRGEISETAYNELRFRWKSKLFEEKIKDDLR